MQIVNNLSNFNIKLVSGLPDDIFFYMYDNVVLKCK